jgi:Flp pilus assembly protein TadG
MNRRPAIPIRRLRRCEAGAAAVELALIAFPMILLALGTFDYFAASYEITTLEGAARGLAEYARDASVCAGGLANPSCAPGISSLFGTMQAGNNSLAGATETPATYYTCTNNALTTSTGPCNVNGDTRVLEYIQITVQQGWWKLFSWDPWSSTNPLVARVSTRIQ